VVVSYGPDGADVHRWNSDFGDLTNVIYREAEGAGILEVTLTADIGFLALLNGFDLGGWSNSDYVITRVEVID